MDKKEINKINKIKDKSNNSNFKKEISDKMNAVKGNKEILK